MSEIRVGVRDLKSRLSEYLRLVRSGQHVIITEHGHPVAQLSPIDQSLVERVKALQATGMVAWNGKRLEALKPAAVNNNQQQVSDLLVEMRQ